MLLVVGLIVSLSTVCPLHGLTELLLRIAILFILRRNTLLADIDLCDQIAALGLVLHYSMH